MLLTWLDRVWTPTALLVPVMFAASFLRYSNLLLGYGVLAALSAYWLNILFQAFLRERRLDGLGKRSPSLRSWSPWNVQVLFAAIWHFTRHRAHEWWWSLFEKTGNPKNPYTVEAITVGDRIIFTADEENIKAILATQFADFGKGDQFRKEWKDFLGYSIFTSDGQMWHNSRTLLRPQFIKDRVSDLHTFETHVQTLLPLLAGSNPGATVEAADLFYRFTLDAATDFLLGRSVDSLVNGQTEFATAFADVQHTQSLIARAGPLQQWVPRKKFFKQLKVLEAFIGSYIDQALALPQGELEKSAKSDDGYTFLHALASYTRDRQVLRDQLMAVLLAGRDTTAVTLSWLFYELSRHPDVVNKLRQEILTSIGVNREPTYADLKSMRYLQHTLNEILRLYPVVPYNVRVALQDCTLPRGGGPNGDEPIGVLEGTPIGYSTLILQRRPDIYPPTSADFPHYMEFAPERWNKWTPKSWTYIPFNGGPRICIGQQFALTEMAYTVVRILQTFDRVECRMDEFPKLKSDIVLQPALGVHIAFFKA